LSEATKVEKREKIRFEIAYQPDLLFFSLSGKMGFEFLRKNLIFVFQTLVAIDPYKPQTLFTLLTVL
jgi:hypothetical protein